MQIKNRNVNKVAWPGGILPLPPPRRGCARGFAVKQRLSNKQAQRNNTVFLLLQHFPVRQFARPLLLKYSHIFPFIFLLYYPILNNV